jgi:UPF0755 protein
MKTYTIPFLTRERLGYLLIGVAVIFTISFFYIGIYLPVNSQARDEIRFHIERGEGSFTIASNLEAEGLVRSRALFTFYALMRGEITHLQSGDYLLAPSMSAHHVLQRLSTGDIISETITIQEGWDLKDMAEAFEKMGMFSAEAFFETVGFPGKTTTPKNFSDEFAFLKDKPSDVSLEGYLFPDTYHITQNEQPENIVRRMLKNFEQKVGHAIAYDDLIMASIIEKEVPSIEDKKIVSGILWKRLANDMRLQVDATVVYVREGNYKIVSIEETRTDSPYNTYVYDGLPPGPISNPGLESIQAALEPEESPYWFYLNPSPTTTIFSRTFEEHKAAKAKYLP